MKTFKQYIKEKYNWKRVAKVGGTTVAASAITGAVTGLGAIPGAALGAAYYAVSGEMKKDLKKKKGDWKYIKEQYYRLKNGAKTNDYQTFLKDRDPKKAERIKQALQDRKKNVKQQSDRK